MLDDDNDTTASRCLGPAHRPVTTYCLHETRRDSVGGCHAAAIYKAAYLATTGDSAGVLSADVVMCDCCNGCNFKKRMSRSCGCMRHKSYCLGCNAATIAMVCCDMVIGRLYIGVRLMFIPINTLTSWPAPAHTPPPCPPCTC